MALHDSTHHGKKERKHSHQHHAHHAHHGHHGHGHPEEEEEHGHGHEEHHGHESHRKGRRVSFVIDEFDEVEIHEGNERTVEELELFRKRAIEDDRMDAIYRASQNFTDKFDNRTYLHPHGMTEYDYKCIAEYRRPDLEKFKHKTRHENYHYLGDHYEIDAMLSLFFKKLLTAKPDDTVHFAAEYFTRDTAALNFEEMLKEEKERISRYRVSKMKAAGKITTRAVQKLVEEEDNAEVHYKRCPKVPQPKKAPVKPPEILDPEAYNKKLQDDVLNWLKKLNIGPLAQDFVDSKEAPPAEPAPTPVSKKKKQKYCGCKGPGPRKTILHPKLPDDAV